MMFLFFDTYYPMICAVSPHWYFTGKSLNFFSLFFFLFSTCIVYDTSTSYIWMNYFSAPQINQLNPFIHAVTLHPDLKLNYSQVKLASKSKLSQA